MTKFLKLVLCITALQGCATTSKMDLQVKPPVYKDCEEVSDLWEKAQVNFSFSCEFR